MAISFKKVFCFLVLIYAIMAIPVFAQEEEEEDWSKYDDMELVDDKNVRRFAKPTIVGLSPTRFLSVSWDMQMPYQMTFSDIRLPASSGTGWRVDEEGNVAETARARFTGGIRFNSNIPVISKSNIVWQTGLNYMRVGYSIDEIQTNRITGASPSTYLSLPAVLNEKGLNNINWTNTVFLPMSEQHFLILQGAMDLSGTYDFGFQPLETIRWSLAAVYGKRVSELKRWGVGIARTYRVGNMNYVPVIMYDVTSTNRKWGTEILFPARVHGRYAFNKNSLLLFGYELEGQSYRVNEFSINDNSFEIRRGELRPRVELQKQLRGPFWAHFQAGYRIDWSFDADELPGGREFFRGFFGNQEFGMKNTLNNTLYFNIGISFVTL
ncbi:hypothetical protein [Cecembia rubra]|uniref:hypothetical protein n=1 Tax=Cecembia rubra TaxID=1485585 RepID=UPI002714B7CC|nr:hypothetical protein [Cecembia rubra]